VLVPTNNNGGGWRRDRRRCDERKESVSVSCVLCGIFFFSLLIFFGVLVL
jgi:hypothetical protein